LLDNEEFICSNLLLILAKLKVVYRLPPQGKLTATVFIEHNAEKVKELQQKKTQSNETWSAFVLAALENLEYRNDVITKIMTRPADSPELMNMLQLAP